VAKHFLYLTNEKLTCLTWRGSGYRARETFDTGNPHALEFERYVARHRLEPTFLVVDLTEEDFRHDKIPHLRGSDQDAVLARKLAQVYRNTTFRDAILQGREIEGRRDDRVLYHAITNAELIKPWLSALEKQGVPLEGIYSVPVLSGRLLKALDVFFPHTLLVSLVSGNGLRQTYFQNKQIKFSRLTRIDEESEISFGQQIADETSRTWQYLDSLRYFSSEDALEVCILVHAKDRKAVTDAIRNYPLLKYRILDSEEVAAKIGLKPAPSTSLAEEIFVHLFARESIQNQYAAPEQTRNARMRKVGLGLYGLAAAFLAVGVVWAGYNLFQASTIDDQIEKSARQSNALNERYRAITGQAQGAQIYSDTSRDTVAFYNGLMQPVPAPAAFLREISTVLNGFPGIRLSQIAWQTHDDPKANPPYSPTASKGEPAIKSDYKASDGGQAAVAPVAAEVKDPPLSGNRHQILILDAAIGSVDGDYRNAIAEIDRLVSAINAIPGLQASILIPPLDLRTVASLKANFSDRETGPAETRFALRVVRVMRDSTAGK
jgi:hypothetical protein